MWASQRVPQVSWEDIGHDSHTHSRYADVLVNVGEILRELAGGAGYVCEAITPIRAIEDNQRAAMQAIEGLGDG